MLVFHWSPRTDKTSHLDWWLTCSFLLLFFLESEDCLPVGFILFSLSLMSRNTLLYFPFRVGQGESEEAGLFFIFTENRDLGGAHARRSGCLFS